ncbi:MAG: Holliday junction resolvase Hjc [Nanoarchaeota archaeon]
MNTKKKGTDAERDLIHKFWGAGWAAFRAAGSGSARYPTPDIIAGNNLRKIAIEVKSVKATRKYFSKQEVDDLLLFSAKFGCEAWLAIKFGPQPWLFVSPEDLSVTQAAGGISLEGARLKGLSFEEMVSA